MVADLGTEDPLLAAAMAADRWARTYAGWPRVVPVSWYEAIDNGWEVQMALAHLVAGGMLTEEQGWLAVELSMAGGVWQLVDLVIAATGIVPG